MEFTKDPCIISARWCRKHIQGIPRLRESASVHHNNIQILITQVYKCPPIVKIIFSFRENKYNIGNLQDMKQQKNRNYLNWSWNSSLSCSSTKFPRILGHYLALIYSNKKLSIGNELNTDTNSVKIT